MWRSLRCRDADGEEGATGHLIAALYLLVRFVSSRMALGFLRMGVPSSPAECRAWLSRNFKAPVKFYTEDARCLKPATAIRAATTADITHRTGGKAGPRGSCTPQHHMHSCGVGGAEALRDLQFRQLIRPNVRNELQTRNQGPVWPVAHANAQIRGIFLRLGLRSSGSPSIEYTTPPNENRTLHGTVGLGRTGCSQSKRNHSAGGLTYAALESPIVSFSHLADTYCHAVLSSSVGADENLTNIPEPRHQPFAAPPSACLGFWGEPDSLRDVQILVARLGRVQGWSTNQVSQ